jgi:hypothetical protein
MCYRQRVAGQVQPAAAGTAIRLWRASGKARWLLGMLLFAVGGGVSRAEGSNPAAVNLPDLTYTNVTDPTVPWSIHVVKVSRSNSRYEIQSRHAGSGALGLSTLRDQIAAVDSQTGEPVAAINGGFYRRDTAYAGAARGLQIVGNRGEVLSAPSGSAAFWIDLNGEAHLANVSSQFEVRWPDGRVTPLGLNEARADNGVMLYTPAVGSATHTAGGLELVLEKQERSRWLPLRVGRFYSARVRAIHGEGNTPLAPDIMVLSFGPAATNQLQGIGTGTTLQISTASSPSLAAARTALSGGPVLVRNGKRQRIRASPQDAYEFSSMLERHPRSAIGWNQDWFYLVEVDGRQRDLSVGMTLEELSTYLVKLGCAEALNLDGGGSATLWCAGEVRNNPCDGYERPVANSLVVLRKAAKARATRLTNQNRPDETERSPAN